MFTQLQQREIFHISFLRQIAGRLKPNSYALKGGINLRLFFGSIRYSEDMDLDIKGIEPFKLKDLVMEILQSKTLSTTLRPFNINKIIPPTIGTAKQTETTQRFKIHLITTSSEDLFTKVEFSRRRLEEPVKTEMISANILQNYMLHPLLVSHYPINSTITQKISALASRSETQARDIFDLYMLLPRLELGLNIKENVIKKARDNIFSLDFHVFKDTVLNYLDEADRNLYDSKNAWEEIQLKLSEVLTNVHHTGHS